MKKGIRKLFVYTISIAMIVVLAGCSILQPASSSNILSVKTAKANKQKISSNIDVAGVLVPAQSVNIASKLSGQVTAINFDVGNTVKKGDVLITLETKSLDAQLQQYTADLKSAEASSISSKSQAEQEKVNLDSAQKNYDRTKSMFDSGAASQSALDDAQNKLDIEIKKYAAAQGPSQGQAEAAIAKAQANINNIKVQLENAVITSPIDGIVTNRNINNGEIASIGNPLLAISDLSTLKLRGTVFQEVVPMLKVGQDIDVTVDIFHDKVFKGKIDNIGPVAVSAGEYFPIEISLKNTGDIKAGLTAHTSINVTTEEGIIVPIEAVVQNNGQNYVFVIKDGKASKRIVTCGIKNDKQIEILKGLDGGDTVAISNVNNLFENMPVAVN